MNRIIGTLCLLISLTSNAQYYYKDIIVSKQTIETAAKYRSQKIHSVNVVSFENTGERTEDFAGIQTISSDYRRITTTFKTPEYGESELTTYYDVQGRLTKSIDTADGSHSVSEYFYNDNGSLAKITNLSVSAGQKSEREEHYWYYNATGTAERMLRVKNGTDTTYITFVTDEKGNIAEENSTRRGAPLPSYFYYYDDKNRLTDVAIDNTRAKRILPLYVFDYNNKDQVITMLSVPEGTDNYQRWMYEYNAAGLKTKETAYDKRKMMLGRIEYVYRN